MKQTVCNYQIVILISILYSPFQVFFSWKIFKNVFSNRLFWLLLVKYLHMYSIFLDQSILNSYFLEFVTATVNNKLLCTLSWHQFILTSTTFFCCPFFYYVCAAILKCIISISKMSWKVSEENTKKKSFVWRHISY